MSVYSVIWFFWALYTAHIADAFVQIKDLSERKRFAVLTEFLKAAEEPVARGTFPVLSAIGLIGLVMSTVPVFRLLGSPWWGWNWGLFLGLVSYGAFVLLDEPKGRSWVKKWAGKAWGKIRKRLGFQKRLRLFGDEKLFRGLEAGLLAQIGDSPLLAPLASEIRTLVHMEAPRLLRLNDEYMDAMLRVNDMLKETEYETESPERQRSIEISNRLLRRVQDSNSLIAELRRKLIHLGPVIEDVRTSIAAGDTASVTQTLRYFDELTSAIHASVAEDVPALPVGPPLAHESPPSSKEEETQTAPPSRTRVS